MRKYTQLCLVIVTVISIIVLLMYRNEYRQLKYVLDVVNFIGRKDEIALVRLENQTSFHQHSLYEFNEPLPMWQRIGNGFHAYSSFWLKQNDLKAGGEVVTIVAALKHSIVSFKCELNYADGRNQKGKFVFVREEVVGDNPNEFAAITENFLVYRFVCKVGKDMGPPSQIIFTDISTKSKHAMQVRNLKAKETQELLTMTVCVDLVPRTHTQFDPFVHEFNLLQFFLHHQLLGIDEFLVYNSAPVDTALRQILLSHGVRLNEFPYNFPFDYVHPSKTRKIVELDCLLRTSNSVKYTSILTPRDYLYTNGHLAAIPQPLLQMLRNPLYENNVQMDIIVNTICAHETKKILSDNLLLSANNTDAKIVLYKTNALFNRHYNTASSQNLVPIRLNKDLIFANNYINCTRGSQQRSDETLVEWRSGISREFQQFIDQVSVDLNTLLRIDAYNIQAN